MYHFYTGIPQSIKKQRAYISFLTNSYISPEVVFFLSSIVFILYPRRCTEMVENIIGNQCVGSVISAAASSKVSHWVWIWPLLHEFIFFSPMFTWASSTFHEACVPSRSGCELYPVCCATVVMNWWPVQGVSLPSACYMLWKIPCDPV